MARGATLASEMSPARTYSGFWAAQIEWVDRRIADERDGLHLDLLHVLRAKFVLVAEERIAEDNHRTRVAAGRSGPPHRRTETATVGDLLELEGRVKAELDGLRAAISAGRRRQAAPRSTRVRRT